MKLTDEQRAAAFAGESSVAVVAGAGTGKTRVLTSRYLHLVQEGAELARILAVTFTEKAAREMKDRIRKALSDKRAQDVEFAPISTIHAFLARLLRERALDAGVDPRFVIADELTSALLLEDALHETVAEMDVATLVELSGAEGFLRELYLAARATPHRMQDLHWSEPDVEAMREEARRFLDECARQQASAPGTVRKLGLLRELTPRLLDPDLGLDAGSEFREAVKGNVAKAQADLFRSGRELAKRWETLAHLPLSRAVAAAVVDALVKLDTRYAEKKRAEGLLDFSDLEHFGLALLRRIDLGDQYDHLLVDEYQDTSRIQEAILECLARGCRSFVVGDAKQSIYRFRYADARVFRELQERATTYPLSGSFRSRPELVAFTNGLFGNLFTGGEVTAQELRATADWREKARKSVELLVVEDERVAASRRKEARALAHRIRDLVKGEQLAITNAARDERCVRYGDCAILLRAMSNLALYERALIEAEVPYVVVMGRGYYAAREVVELAFLLSMLHDPHDRYRSTAVMTSLLCGVPEADLMRLPGKRPLATVALEMDRPVDIPAERWERLVTFGKRFLRWREMVGRVDCGDLVEAILSETRFAELLLLELGGRRRHANLMKALRRARQGQSEPALYARELLEFRERELRESEAPIAGETEDAVKIMTVHAAKGLEFPVVAVADLTWHKSSGRGPVLEADGSFGFALRNHEAPGLKELRRREEARERDEQLRLLYVAFTRAEEHLLLSAARHKNEDLRVLDPLTDAPPPELECVDTKPLLRDDRRGRSGADVRAALRRRDAMPSRLARDDAGADEVLDRIRSVVRPEIDGAPYVAAVADLVEYQRCPRRYRLGRMLGIEIEEDTEGREPLDADEHPRREQGTAFHAVINDIGPGAVPDEAKVYEHFPEARSGDVARIVAWSEWLADQEIARNLQGVETLREMPFFARVSGLPVRGVIDLYAPSLPLLLDYKTGAKVRPGEYDLQVAVYLAALKRIGKPAPPEAHLVYVDAKTVKVVEPEPLRDLIEEFLQAHRGAGQFPPTPSEACTYCDFRKACVAQGLDCPGELRLF